jgi:hypothetical protein
MAHETAAAAEPEHTRLKFLLRSGNSIMVDGVLGWEMKHLEGRVISLTLKQSLDPRFARVIVDSIDLAQIEAVVILPADGARRAARQSEKEGGDVRREQD